MEIALPLVALSGLYLINKQPEKKESFQNQGKKINELLPNTDSPNRNYPTEYPIASAELDQTSLLSNNNKFHSAGGVYTDKFFNPNQNPTIVRPAAPSAIGATPYQYQSLAGDTVDSTYFQHNNMVPFFGSNIRTRHTDDKTSNESVLDNMAGSGSQLFSKREQSPMFSPHDNLQWANGTPSTSDFIQSRMNVGMRMANVKPFEEQRVAPGLGLGYTTEGSGGFNSGMSMRDQWVDRGVDELRVANKPKSSGHVLLGHEGPAMSKITNVGSIGKVEKNRVDRAWEMGPERLFTTTGAEKGPTLHSIPIDRHVSRPETSAAYTGAAGYSTDATYVPGEYMPSTNIELGEVPFGVATATGKGFATTGDYEVMAKRAYPNNRTSNKPDEYYGIMGGAIGAVVAPLLDVLRPSRKENMIGNLRPYQNAKSSVPQSYIFNPADRLPTTMRETTENSKFHLNVNANQLGGAYRVTEHQPALTARQSTDDIFYMGNAGAGEGIHRQRNYEAEYNQHNNDIKSSTIQGYMVQGNMNLMNGNMNMKSKPKENFMKNTREVAPTMPYQTPDIANFGMLQGNSGLYQGAQLDRADPSLLNALQSNPYALSVTSAFRK
jgi:hypothetical protein